jgi:hypothetical protein
MELSSFFTEAQRGWVENKKGPWTPFFGFGKSGNNPWLIRELLMG